MTKTEQMIELLESALVYCKSSRRANQISLCKLQIRDEIQPSVEKTLTLLRSRAVPSELKAEDLARLFHITYERLAPKFGYETRKESAKPWDEVSEKNKALMTAVCKEILRLIYYKPEVDENRNLREQLEQLQAENERYKNSLKEIRDLETECCSRCEGNGQLWADGKVHLPSYQGNTIPCGNCGGSGRILPDNAQDIAEQALKGEGNEQEEER